MMHTKAKAELAVSYHGSNITNSSKIINAINEIRK